MKKFRGEYLFIVFCVLVLGFAIFKVILKGDLSHIKFLNISKKTAAPAVETIPTQTPEEIKIISRSKNKEVTVTEEGINPVALTIKQFDQISFLNKTLNTNIKVVGKDWGNFLFGSGENMAQIFEQKGTFEYKVDGLSKNFSGKIVVE